MGPLATTAVLGPAIERLVCTPIITTTTGATAAVQAIAALRAGTWGVRALQDYYPHFSTGAEAGADPAK